MESIELSPSYPDRLRLERLALVVCTAMGSFLALLVTNARCGAIDTLAVDLHPSAYCKALGLPSVATSGSAALLTFGVFGALRRSSRWLVLHGGAVCSAVSRWVGSPCVAAPSSL